jgi:hypothetical protein
MRYVSTLLHDCIMCCFALLVPLCLQSLQQPSQQPAAVASGQQQQLWCPDRSAMAAAGVDKLTWLPQGVQAVLLLHLPLGKEGGMLVVASDRERYYMKECSYCCLRK